MAHPSHAARVLYEDCPASRRSASWGLGLPGPSQPEAPIRDLITQTHGIGPGDHKIVFTTDLRAESICKTTFVPRELLPDTLSSHVDALQDQLGYVFDQDTWRLSSRSRSGALPATQPNIELTFATLVASLREITKSIRDDEWDSPVVQLVISDSGTGTVSSAIPVPPYACVNADGVSTLRIYMAEDVFLGLATGLLNMADLVDAVVSS